MGIDCASNWQAFTTYILPWLSPALVVLGWWIVNKQNNAREKRKEVRQLADRIINDVDELAKKTTEYHSRNCDSAEERKSLGWRLTLSLTRLSSHLQLLHDKGLDTGDCNVAYIELKRIATGGDFMTAGESIWPLSDMRWIQLLYATERLCKALESAFNRAFG